MVCQFTAKGRFKRTLKAIYHQCRAMRHWPVREQHLRLSRTLTGHFAYFGITGNFRRLAQLHHRVKRIWHKWLARRSWATLPWVKFNRLLACFPLPRPRIFHCYVH